MAHIIVSGLLAAWVGNLAGHLHGRNALRLQRLVIDAQGNAYLTTGYDAYSGGSIVNQVEDIFNGLGQLTGEYQAVDGAVSTSTPAEVQYAYTEMSGGQNNSRQTAGKGDVYARIISVPFSPPRPRTEVAA